MEQTGNRGISAAVLKNVALITMTIDHITAIVFKAYLYGTGVSQLYSNDLYVLGRVIGRIAFVLYAFMLAEGAVKTRNKVKYAARLLALALISVVPHSFADAQKWIDLSDLNIFFLLFLGLLTIYAYEWLKVHIPQKAGSVILRILAIAAAGYLSLICNFEYGMMGILLIMVFYIFRDHFPRMALFTVLVMSVGYMANVILKNNAVIWFARHNANLLNAILNTDKIQIFGLLALPFIYFYNGKKGRQLPKAFYYFYYPVHLGILGLIAYFAF